MKLEAEPVALTEALLSSGNTLFKRIDLMKCPRIMDYRSRHRLLSVLGVLCVAIALNLIPPNELLADCDTPVSDPLTGSIEASLAPGNNSAVAIKADGKMIVVWETRPSGGLSSHFETKAARLDVDLTCLGTTAFLVDTSNPSNLANRRAQNPSVAMTTAGYAHVAFAADWAGGSCSLDTTGSIRSLTFPFGNPLDPFSPPTAATVATCTEGPGDHSPSAGIDAVDCKFVAWTNNNAANFSMLQGLVVKACSTPTQSLRACDNSASVCFWARWSPCVATRADGYSAVVWAEPEDPSDIFSSMNILLQIRDASGDPQTSDLIVNQPYESADPDNPPLEIEGSSQESPAVAFDAAGRIVVVWTGPKLDSCDDP